MLNIMYSLKVIVQKVNFNISLIYQKLIFQAQSKNYFEKFIVETHIFM